MSNSFESSSLLHSSFSHPLTRTWNSSSLSKSDLMFPVFVHSGNGKVPIEALPSQFRYGLDTLVSEFTPLVQNGLKSIIIFGVPGDIKKDHQGTMADTDSIVVKAIEIFRKSFPDLLVACDVCLCAYTDHGHCGVMENGELDNGKSIERLAEVALAFAKAGCQLIAPSDMMDGRIKAIKTKLIEHGLGSRVGVMSYSAKFASCFYGPFRSAAGSAPSFGDRKCYQLPPGSRGLARRALNRDKSEGADIVMIKPAYPYLDIVSDARDICDLPVAIYQVSGEYAMLWHSAEHGVFELKDAVMESLVSAKRAGATILITYYTPMLLEWLNQS